MQTLITGKKIDIGEALRTHTEEKMRELVDKYSLTPVECSVVIEKTAEHEVRSDFDLHLGRDVHVRAHASSDDAHFSVDNAIHTLEKRIRKHKSRLIDHQKKKDMDLQKRSAQQYILNPMVAESNAAGSETYPLIIAEVKTQISRMTVGEAVMTMDLGDQQAIIFHNDAHGRLNVVYKRADGNIGWIDPTEE